MKSTSKARGSPKPPTPSRSHAEIGEWIGAQMPALQPILHAIDRQIRDAIPAAHFAIKWKKAYYGLDDQGWLIEMVAYDVSVNVVFFGGADFDEPPPLGDAGRSRYVKLKSLEEAREPSMRSWIKQAARAPGWR